MHKTHRECISFEYSYPQLLVDKWITMVDKFLVLLGVGSLPLVGAAIVEERRRSAAKSSGCWTVGEVC